MIYTLKCPKGSTLRDGLIEKAVLIAEDEIEQKALADAIVKLTANVRRAAARAKEGKE